MDERAILEGLQAANHLERVQAVDGLRQRVRKHGGELRFRNVPDLVRLISATLQDDNWIVRRDSIAFLTEILPMCDSKTSALIVLLIPNLALNLGDAKVAIRSSTISTLMLAFRFVEDTRALMEAFVNDALESGDVRVRTESLYLLTSKLPWEALAPQETFTLIEAVIGRLRDVQREVVRAACKVISFAASVLGAETFKGYLSELSPSLQRLYEQALQTIEGRHSAGAGNGSGSKSTRGSRSSITSTPVPAADNGGFKGNSSGSRLDASGGGGSVRNEFGSQGEDRQGEMLGGDSGAPLAFGFLPASVITKFRDASGPVRVKAIDDTAAMLVHLENMQSLVPTLGRLLNFLGQLLNDSNLKVVIGALQAIGVVVGRVGWPMRSYLETLMERLVGLLGDNKILVRQSNIKLIAKIMHALTPGPVLEILASHLNHSNWRVREEIVNTIILSASSPDAADTLDFELMAQSLLPCLADPKPRVKYVTLEAFAVFYAKVGESRLWDILGRLRIDSQLRAVLAKRFDVSQLPIINKDGIVEHLRRSQSAASSYAGDDRARSSGASVGASDRGTRYSRSASRTTMKGLPWGDTSARPKRSSVSAESGVGVLGSPSSVRSRNGAGGAGAGSYASIFAAKNAKMTTRTKTSPAFGMSNSSANDLDGGVFSGGDFTSSNDINGGGSYSGTSDMSIGYEPSFRPPATPRRSSSVASAREYSNRSPAASITNATSTGDE